MDEISHFSGNETRLYFGLLHTCNKLGWKNPFKESDRFLSRILGMSANTIRGARKGLITAGLITVSIPDKKSKSINGQSIYQILTVSKIDTVETKKKKKPHQKLNQGVSNFESPTVSKIESPTVSNFESNIKLKDTKLKDTKPFSLNGEEKKTNDNDFEIIDFNEMPFLNEQTNEMWGKWLMYLEKNHHWIIDQVTKGAQFAELVNLSDGDELKMAAIINQAIAGNYRAFAPLKNRKTFQEMQYDRRRQLAAIALQPTQPIHENEVDIKPINPWAPVLEMLKPINQNLRNFGERIDVLSQKDDFLILTNGVEVNRNFEFTKNGERCSVRGIVEKNKKNTRV